MQSVFDGDSEYLDPEVIPYTLGAPASIQANEHRTFIWRYETLDELLRSRFKPLYSVANMRELSKA